MTLLGNLVIAAVTSVFFFEGLLSRAALSFSGPQSRGLFAQACGRAARGLGLASFR